MERNKDALVSHFDFECIVGHKVFFLTHSKKKYLLPLAFI